MKENGDNLVFKSHESNLYEMTSAKGGLITPFVPVTTLDPDLESKTQPTQQSSVVARKNQKQVFYTLTLLLIIIGALIV
jgi:hypothetical protein